jgi:photosystem II stability/assembly factor-like uncharacterized protein
MGSTLPSAAYTLHVSRAGQLYASSTAIYQYIPPARGWRKVSPKAYEKLLVISDDLAFGLDSNHLVKLTNDFTEKTKLDTCFSAVIIRRDYSIGPDSAIYLSLGNVGILRSKDLGQTWDTLTASIGPIAYYGLEVDAAGTIYAWNNEVVRSTDGGTTWEMVFYYHKDDQPALCKPYASNTYILSQNGIVYYGNDSLSRIPRNWSTEEMDLTIHKDGQLYFHPQRSSPLSSSDSGLHWDTLRLDGIAFPPSSMACDSTGLLYLAAGALYVSDDHGSSWTVLTHLMEPFTFVGCDPDSILYGRNKDGFYRSTDNGYSWRSEKVEGVRNIYSMSSGPTNELFAICRDSFNNVILGSKRSDSSPWIFTSPLPFQDATTPYLASGRLLSGELWAVDAEGYFSRLDLDNTWRNSFVLDVPGFDVRIAAPTDSNTIIVSGYAAIYRSADKGKTFRRAFDFASPEELALAIAFNPAAIYILTTDNHIYCSTNKGSTWQLFAAPKEALYYLVTTNDGALYLATGTGVFRNLTGFNNPFVWEDVSGTIKGLSIQKLALRSNKHLYALTAEKSIYYTDLVTGEVRTSTDNIAVAVYPNPATRICYITGPMELEGAQVECYNTAGINVLRTKYRDGLDVTALPCGMYQLILRTGKTSLRTKLIVDHTQ